jgi:hypothetical protein
LTDEEVSALCDIETDGSTQSHKQPVVQNLVERGLVVPSEEPLARVKLTALAQQRLSKRGVGLNESWVTFRENENAEERAGVVLKAGAGAFVFATNSFISGYGSVVSVAASSERRVRSTSGMGSLIELLNQDGAPCTSYFAPWWLGLLAPACTDLLTGSSPGRASEPEFRNFSARAFDEEDKSVVSAIGNVPPP